MKYRDYDAADKKGEYAKIFEEEYTEYLKIPELSFDQKYQDYLDNIDVGKTHNGYFSKDKKGRLIDSKETKTGENKGGFNILNISNWTLVRNKAWIWDAAGRGDMIRFISDPKKPKNIYRNGISGELTVTGEEVKLIESLGYRWNPNTKQYTKD